MYSLPNELTLDALRKYSSYLFSRINESGSLTFKQVEIDGQLSLARNCHENTRGFLKSNSSHKIIYGWIFEKSESKLEHIEFFAHSVIQDPDGYLFDITPIQSNKPVMFLAANLNDNDFADIVNELEKLAGTATLIYHNAFK